MSSARLSGSPSFVTEPKSWDVDLLDYGALELSADTINVSLAGVSTSARQDTGNASLAAALTELQSILAKLNASIAVTGTVTANAGTNLNTSALGTETTLAAIKTQTDKLAFTGSLLQTSASLVGSGGDGAILDGTNPLVKATVTASNALKVDGSAVTQPVSVSAALPTGANSIGQVTANAGTNLNTSALATVAKQPALGVAGTASSNVITVQGIQDMTSVITEITTGAGAFAAKTFAGDAPAHSLRGLVTHSIDRANTDTGSTAPSNANLIGARVDAVAPSGYLDSRIQPLSLTTGGSLRTDVISALPEGTNVIGHVIVDSAPSSASAATALAVDADAGYSDGATGQALTQTLDGRLRVVTSGLVSDTPESYISGTMRTLSLNSDGRLRVSAVPAPTYLEMFMDESNIIFDMPALTSNSNIWDVGASSPRGALR